MKVELKNIKHCANLSEETNAFTANVYVDGKKVAYAKNDGQGGETIIHPFEGKRDELVKIEKYFKELKSTLEDKVDNLIYTDLLNKDKAKQQKALDKNMIKGICFGGIFEYKIISWKNYTLSELLPTPVGKELIRRTLIDLQKKGENILNTNIPAELYKKAE